MIAVDPRENLVRIEVLGALLGFLGVLRFDGIDFGLGDEPVAVGIEPGEHLADMRLDVGAGLGLRRVTRLRRGLREGGGARG
jgi:hypothetical protein